MQVPSELLECEALPAVPANATLQSEISRYILQLWSTADDCKAKLSDVNKIIQKE